MTEEKKEHFAIDLDGTLIAYDGWKGEEVLGEPLPDALRFVFRVLGQGHEVTVFTTRTNQDFVQKYLMSKGFPKLTVTNIKIPQFSVFIDDRGHRFNGELAGWNVIIEMMEQAGPTCWLPWYMRPKKETS